jgi:hypothetical protein
MEGAKMNKDHSTAMEHMTVIYPNLAAMVGHIKAIMEEEDAEVIAVYLEAMQVCEDNINAVWGRNPFYSTVKDSIRAGHGDFAKIKDKCIRLGVV